MYKVIETQYLNDGTRTDTMTKCDTEKEAREKYHYQMFYAYNQHYNARLQIIGENGENIENSFADGRVDAPAPTEE